MIMPSGPPTALPSAAAARKSAARWRAQAAAALPPPTALRLPHWIGAAHFNRAPDGVCVVGAGRHTDRADNSPTAACIVEVTAAYAALPE